MYETYFENELDLEFRLENITVYHPQAWFSAQDTSIAMWMSETKL
jgi:hypothetical protein